MAKKTIVPPLANRLQKLPPYLFVEIDNMKAKALSEGRDVIDLGVGDPDQPTPDFIIKALHQALKKSQHHRYPSNKGLGVFREAIAKWMKLRFKVTVNPDTEILPLIGSKEGIAHLPMAFVNPGDRVLVPDPGYPPYQTGTILAGGIPVNVPLLAKNDFFPDLNAVPVKAKTKLFFLNYPNNPTAALATPKFFRELVQFARKSKVPICHDAAYTEVFYGKKRPISFLQTPGAKEVGIEFHSLSKPFNMTGWRVGWVCGNKDMIAALAKVKSNIDSGIFEPLQLAGIKALENKGPFLKKMMATYQERRDVMVEALQKANWPVEAPDATFYIWAPIPKKASSKEVAARFLQEADIVATPGNGFGPSGEGYVRFSLSVPTPLVKKAAKRITQLKVW